MKHVLPRLHKPTKPLGGDDDSALREVAVAAIEIDAAREDEDVVVEFREKDASEESQLKPPPP